MKILYIPNNLHMQISQVIVLLVRFSSFPSIFSHPQPNQWKKKCKENRMGNGTSESSCSGCYCNSSYSSLLWLKCAFSCGCLVHIKTKSHLYDRNSVVLGFEHNLRHSRQQQNQAIGKIRVRKAFFMLICFKGCSDFVNCLKEGFDLLFSANSILIQFIL